MEARQTGRPCPSRHDNAHAFGLARCVLFVSQGLSRTGMTGMVINC